MDPKKITAFHKEILSWYATHQRDLPWRKTRDPYHILISEVMSQQTQINRVVPKYEAWIIRFPTLRMLAESETGEVLKYWSGLGYNRRAINLQKTARILVNRHNGQWPRTVEELKKFPGVGEYTASAIACFAFDEQIAVVDTNVRKVIGTKFLKGNVTKVTDKELKAIAAQLLPKGRAYDWNQALMDYASAMLKQEKIPIPKQSTFKGSNRYYRGQTVKLLIENKGASIKQLGKWLDKDVIFVERLVQKLERDGLVVIKKDQISLP